MSTLKTVSVIHPSGSVTNISNDSSGNVTIGNNLTVTGTTTLTGSLGNITTGTINSGAITSSGAVSGTSLTSSGTVTATTGVLYPIVAKTAVTLTTQTSVNFTDIPSWVKRITIIFNEVSTNASTDVIIQIGDSGGIETTGYVSSSCGSGGGTTATSSSTAGYVLRTQPAADAVSGHMVLTPVSGNVWISSHAAKRSTSVTIAGGGSKTLSDTLTQLRLTTSTGTDQFDGGSINILYE